MKSITKTISTSVVGVVLLATAVQAQALSPAQRAKVDAKAKALQAWASDPALVAAVREHNANPPAADKAMTNDKWKGLTLLDPYVRSFSKNAAGTFLKSKKDETIAECFVSSADGTKVAFLSKTTSWSHASSEKHTVPMSGRIYVGPIATDDSTGLQLVQVGLPVLDGGKPIGSIVVGLAISKL